MENLLPLEETSSTSPFLNMNLNMLQDRNPLVLMGLGKNWPYSLKEKLLLLFWMKSNSISTNRNLLLKITFFSQWRGDGSRHLIFCLQYNSKLSIVKITRICLFIWSPTTKTHVFFQIKAFLSQIKIDDLLFLPLHLLIGIIIFLGATSKMLSSGIMKLSQA
jgi:hypothetical protein